MDEVPDSIVNAVEEAKRGHPEAVAALFGFVCTQLWKRVRDLESTVTRQEAELEKHREPW